MKIIRLIILDDNKLLREGIKEMLSDQPDIKVVASIGDKVKVTDRIDGLKPDVLLMDLGLEHQNSIELLKCLKEKFPDVKVIVMDLFPFQPDIKRFIQAGASGFIVKDAPINEYLRTLRMVADGEKVFPAQKDGTVFSRIIRDGVKEIENSKLIESMRMTQTEQKILGLVADGLSDTDISRKLPLSVYMVKGHIHNILEKMALNTRVQITIDTDPE